jgi:hypothetical protein
MSENLNGKSHFVDQDPPTWEIIIINLEEVCENEERIKVTEDMV